MSTLTHLPAETRPLGRAVLFALFLLGGLAIFVFGSPFNDVFLTNDNPLYAAALAVASGLAALGLWRSPHYARYAPPVYALFVAAAANLVLVIGPFNRFVTAGEPYRLMAQDKLAQFLAVVPVILILSWLARRDLGWIYLQRGRPRRWLPFGLASFAACAVVMVAIMLSSGIDAAGLLAVAPAILAFVVLNAIMEELWFRAVFLRPYEAELGGIGAVVVTALVFGASHVNATYFDSWMGAVFGLVVIAVGLVAAWAMRWAGSLWGAVLFHMGMDLLIILPIAQSL